MVCIKFNKYKIFVNSSINAVCTEIMALSKEDNNYHIGCYYNEYKANMIIFYNDILIKKFEITKVK